MLYICKDSNKFDLNQAIRVSHIKPTGLLLKKNISTQWNALA